MLRVNSHKEIAERQRNKFVQISFKPEGKFIIKTGVARKKILSTKICIGRIYNKSVRLKIRSPNVPSKEAATNWPEILTRNPSTICVKGGRKLYK